MAEAGCITSSNYSNLNVTNTLRSNVINVNQLNVFKNINYKKNNLVTNNILVSGIGTYNNIHLGNYNFSKSELNTIDQDFIINSSKNILFKLNHLNNVGIGCNKPLATLHIHKNLIDNKIIQNNSNLLIESENSKIELVSLNEGHSGSMLILNNIEQKINKRWTLHHTGNAYDNKLNIFYKENNNNKINDDLKFINSDGITINKNSNVGIGIENTLANLHIKDKNNNCNLILENYNNKLEFSLNEQDLIIKKYFEHNNNHHDFQDINKQRVLMNERINSTHKGLIASTYNIYNDIVYCKLSNKNLDSNFCGVISNKETNNDERNIKLGNINNIIQKKYKNDYRIILNISGFTDIWVINNNGNISQGDLITSSSVLGYGTKQVNNELFNYTIGKSLCNCNFNLDEIKINKLKITDNTLQYNLIDGEIKLEKSENSQKNYQTRFVNNEGSIIDLLTYTQNLTKNEESHIACLIKIKLY